MYMIDFHDDDRNVDLSIGPFPEEPSTAQVVAAIRAVAGDHGPNGYAWFVRRVRTDLLPMPVPTEADVEIADRSDRFDRGGGYVVFRDE